MRSHLVHAALAGAIAAAPATAASQPRRPLPPGTQITAQDGDTIILAGDVIAEVTIGQ